MRYVMSLFKYRDHYIKKAYLIHPVDVDITNVYRKNKRFDANVVYKVVYVFNNKEYVYITRDNQHVWPPKRKGMTFCCPIKQVLLNTVDITEHVKKYAGPFNDFHHETVTFVDMGLPENAVLELVDVTGTRVTRRDSLNHRMIWMPNKT